MSIHSTRAAGVVEALGLDRSPALVSIVGGGGKSSLMFALGDLLPGRVVLTTTTRIFAAQMNQADAVCTLGDTKWEDQLGSFDSSLLVVGGVEGERAVGVPAELPAQMLARTDIDWVVVEADGSRMLPVKAPAEHEPVIPAETDLYVAVVGIDALSAPIGEVAHRPERVSALTGLSVEQTLTPDALAVLMRSPDGGLKNAPAGARAAVLINKVESAYQRDAARDSACGMLHSERVERVVIGALQGTALPGTSDWEIWTR